MAEETPSVLRQYGDDVTAKDVLDAAKAGDELALSVVETVGRYLGMALAGIAMGGSEMFVIGGGVSKAGQFLIDIIDKYYQHYSPISQEQRASLDLRSWEMTPESTGQPAWYLGRIANVLKKYPERDCSG